MFRPRINAHKMPEGLCWTFKNHSPLFEES